MLRRDTLNHGIDDVNADIEVAYTTSDGQSTLIPFSSEWKNIFVQTSGGLDSALLLYLTAKTFAAQKSDVKIIPFSLEIPTKAKNLASARAVIQRVRVLTGYQNLQSGVEGHIPMELSENPHKDAFFNSTLKSLWDKFDISFEFNGNTKNPPNEARRHFRDNDHRQLTRDNRTTIYNSRYSASPHAMIDKKGIVELYIQQGILNELAPFTLSCDINLSEAKERGLDIPCQECWWCRERDWGFKSNGATDLSQSINSKVLGQTECKLVP